MTRDASRWLVGGYGPDMGGTGEGVYGMTRRADGTLGDPQLVERMPSPSYLLRDGDAVFAALEGEGAIARLGAADRAASGGRWPCHLSLHDGRLVVANYDDGVVGFVDPAPLALVTALAATAGRGAHERQDRSHVHSSATLPSGDLVVADLGLDALHVLRDGERARSVALPAGTGPRDLLVLPSDLLLVLGELGSRILTLDGALDVVGDWPLPDAAPTDLAAALVPLGDRWLVMALRGSDRVLVVEIVDGGRELDAVASAQVGRGPRHLAVDGELIHVACQLDDRIDTLRFDGHVLSFVGSSDTVPAPTFLLGPRI